MDALLSLMPEEEQVRYSALTGQALYYFGEKDLRHKILCIAEEQGAARASYALKLLLSEGRLSIASTGKDPQSGKLVTQEYGIEGPVVLFITTTAIELDEELQNRCIVLCVDEGRLQTRAIHALQRRRRGVEGLWAEEQGEQLLGLHQDAQRLLRPLHVLNPYAEQLTFLDDRTRTRRDHLKYLTLIQSIALLKQYQRPVRASSWGAKSKSYIEVEPGDIALANRLANEAMGRSLDELSGQTRRLLELVHQMVQAECARQAVEQGAYRFSRREVRLFTGWSDFQVKMHMKKLEELEYVLIHRGGRGQSFVYELLYRGEGQDGERFVLGLLDPKRLQRHNYDPNKEHPCEGLEHPKEQLEHPKKQLEPSRSIQGDRKEPPGSIGSKADDKGVLAHFEAQQPKNAHLEGAQEPPSYPHERRNGRGAGADAEVA